MKATKRKKLSRSANLSNLSERMNEANWASFMWEIYTETLKKCLRVKTFSIGGATTATTAVKPKNYDEKKRLKNLRTRHNTHTNKEPAGRQAGSTTYFSIMLFSFTRAVAFSHTTRNISTYIYWKILTVCNFGLDLHTCKGRSDREREKRRDISNVMQRNWVNNVNNAINGF